MSLNHHGFIMSDKGGLTLTNLHCWLHMSVRVKDLLLLLMSVDMGRLSLNCMRVDWDCFLLDENLLGDLLERNLLEMGLLLNDRYLLLLNDRDLLLNWLLLCG